MANLCAPEIFGADPVTIQWRVIKSSDVDEFTYYMSWYVNIYQGTLEQPYKFVDSNGIRYSKIIGTFFNVAFANTNLNHVQFGLKTSANNKTI